MPLDFLPYMHPIGIGHKRFSFCKIWRMEKKQASILFLHSGQRRCYSIQLTLVSLFVWDSIWHLLLLLLSLNLLSAFSTSGQHVCLVHDAEHQLFGKTPMSSKSEIVTVSLWAPVLSVTHERVTPSILYAFS